jgi:hypothetical protein
MTNMSTVYDAIVLELELQIVSEMLRANTGSSCVLAQSSLG